ncbi:Flp pilus assembly protein TadG [Clostridiales Family XIII bacterium PM5-7]
MKNAIITIGAMLFMTIMIGYQMELNQLLREKEMLTFVAEEAAIVAANQLEHSVQKDATEAAKKAVALNLPERRVSVEVTFHQKSKSETLVNVNLIGQQLQGRGCCIAIKKQKTR